MRATKAVIDLKAVEHNLSVVKTLAPKSNVMAVLKANAYGHGLANVARAIPQQEAIAVACMDEAEILRSSGVKNEIILLEGFFSEEELKQVVELELQTVVHQDSQVNQLEKLSEDSSTNPKIVVWLKYDSGMNRL
ncbi:MAG: alanine racemase, partial [Kangiellaceae bacterium]|nr:alanine racemase [Kangiellaceae bacterium]